MAAHLLLIPFRDTGHMNPAIILATKLAMQGVRITLLALDTESESMASKRISSLGLNNVKVSLARIIDHGPGALDDAECSKSKALEKFLHEFLDNNDDPPKSVIVDVILAWTKSAIAKFNLKRYLLYTTGATSLSFALHLHGPPPSSRHSHQEHRKLAVHDWKQDVLDSSGVLVNSSYELEKDSFDLIHNNAMKNVLPIGPLLDVSKEYSNPSSLALEWLDQQPESSVVYVSFGSRTHLSTEQIQELAYALESSGKAFLWVLPPSDGSDGADSFLKKALPGGFLNRISAGNRGIVVPGWAPQVEILSHLALAAFVTHCGWNSVVECIFLAELPPVMVCWPFGADQPTNCKFVVEDAQIGIRISGSGGGGGRGTVAPLIDRHEIEGKIRAAFFERSEMRQRAAKLRIATRSSVQPPTGSSVLNFDKFIAQI